MSANIYSVASESSDTVVVRCPKCNEVQPLALPKITKVFPACWEINGATICKCGFKSAFCAPEQPVGATKTMEPGRAFLGFAILAGFVYFAGSCIWSDFTRPEREAAAQQRASQQLAEAEAVRATLIEGAVRGGNIIIGMSDADVRRSWGTPDSVNRTTLANGVREQWVYRRGYLYFENSILTVIQEKR